jgi:DNA-binding NarL/FixJ family response regulator
MEASMPSVILVAGNCSPDNAALRRTLNQAFGSVEWMEVDSRRELVSALSDRSPDLVLVNRVFDATGEDGIAIIRELAGSESKTRFMLISNFGWAQDEAMQAGAVAGFGKSQLFEGATIERIRSALGLPVGSKHPL